MVIPFCTRGSWRFVGFIFGAILLLTQFALPQTLVHAKLLPTQLVILANENEPESLRVALHYANQRGIPRSHIVNLNLPSSETISWEDYEKHLAIPLKEALITKKLSGIVRVIVTTYGVPLRVTAPQQSEQEKAWQTDADEWHGAAMDFLKDIHLELLGILESIQKETQSPGIAFSGNLGSSRGKQKNILTQIETTIRKIHAQLRNKDASPVHQDLKTQFFKSVLQFEGLSAYHTFQGNPSTLSEPVSLSTGQLHTQLKLAQQLLSLLIQHPTKQHRDWAYQLAQRFFGLRGVFRLSTTELDQFTHKDAAASVDSELCVLWLDPREYSPHGRIPNPFYAWHRPQQKQEDMPYPLLMVSRIDAPTPDLAKQLIDRAIMAEQMGLAGKVYLDARGLKRKQALGYGDYDQSLRNLGRFIENHTTYPVILENSKKRFRHPGDAPDVALYAGWYRLRHYEDAFSFNPGAIGYHIASGEAISIHRPREKGWCKNALERGITATIGPTSEPYLDAFPKPSEFFGLILSGRYSLIEAYYLSIRHVSWRMVLFGDPLYNPWKGVTLATLPGLQQSIPEFTTLKTLPLAPSDMRFPDPIQSAQTRQTLRERLLSQVVPLLNSSS